MINVVGSQWVSVGFRYGLSSIDVESNDPDDARWLTEFLTPWFEVSAHGNGDFAVRITRSESAFADLKRKHDSVAYRPVACFALDSKVVEFPGWEEDEAAMISDAEHSCFYRVRNRNVEIIARPGVFRTRVGLMRVVRELATAMMLGQENILDVHAAAFTVKEQAVLLVGPKSSGKTTLLVYALTSGQAGLIANDRILLDVRLLPWRVLGVPTLSSIREGTLRVFPHLRLNALEQPALLHVAELESSDTGSIKEPSLARNFTLSLTQLAWRLNSKPVRCAPITAIVFPEIVHEASSLSIHLLSPSDGAVRLRDCLYGARVNSRLQTIFGKITCGLDSPGQDQSPLVNDITAHIPLFRCRLGRDAYRCAADAWLRNLDVVLKTAELKT
jgi:hypothetical protein